jgi:hypothetical protein
LKNEAGSKINQVLALFSFSVLNGRNPSSPAGSEEMNIKSELKNWPPS